MESIPLLLGRLGVCVHIAVSLCHLPPCALRVVRVVVNQVRMELAEYIAGIRLKEAESDMADYLETHKLTQKKDALKKTITNTVGLPFLRMRRKKLE